MVTFKIKITGSGTPKEIIESLQKIIGNIKIAENKPNTTAVLDGAEWEDPTLMTEISAE